ncbi:TPA: hypothetical protein ACGZ88_000119 [Morganella morganii]
MVERVKSPIVGTFIFVWLFYNWKVILILLFSKGDIENKINVISGYITEKSFYYPFLIAVLYCVAIPIVTLIIDVLLRKASEAAIELRYEKINKEYKEKKKTEILRADADIAYERKKTDEEKEIQSMREQITQSKANEGVLAKERDDAIEERDNAISRQNDYKDEIITLINQMEENKLEIDRLSKENSKLKSQAKLFSLRNGTVKSKSENKVINKALQLTLYEKIKSMNHGAERLYLINDNLKEKIKSIPNLQYSNALFSTDERVDEFLGSLDQGQLLHLYKILDEE